MDIGVNEIVQKVKALVPVSKGLNSILRTHMMDGKLISTNCHLFSGLQMHTMCTHTQRETHTNTNKCFLKDQ